MKHFSSLLISLLSVVALFANPLAQAQSPTVVGAALSPTRNALAAPRAAPVVMPFSQAINPATAGNIKVFSSQYLGRRTATASASGSTVTLLPTAPAGQSAAFKPGEKVTVTVPATVLGAGGAAAVPHVYQFTAAATGGSGRFLFGSSVPVVRTNWSADVKVSDLDSDGDLDFVTNSGEYAFGGFGGLTSGVINIRLNDGNGNFAAAPNITVPLGPASVALGDVDGDGDLDIVTANNGGGSFPFVVGNTVSICLNNGAGLFANPANTVVSPSPLRLELGDLDGDGDLDLVVYGSLLQALFNNGNGGFGGAVTLATGTTFPTGVGVALADMDGDGDLDIVGPNMLYRNNGQGGFSAFAGITTKRYNDVLGDVDGDGDLDLVTAGNPLSPRIFLNNGNGGSTVTRTLPTASASDTCIALGDLDGDGDLDLIAPIFNNNLGLNVWLNDGNGNFSALPTRLGTTQAMNMTLADADGDGDLDLFVFHYLGVVDVLLNGAVLASTPAQATMPASVYPNPASATDLVQVSVSVPSEAREVRATVVNALGQIVATSSLRVQAYRAAGTLPTAGLIPGIYSVRLQAGAAVVTKRLVVN